MKVLHHMILICAACVLAGCSRPEPTLDEAIDALTDDWGERYKIGESYSNNYAVLKRVIAVTNVDERIRLAWKLYNRFGSGKKKRPRRRAFLPVSSLEGLFLPKKHIKD